MTSSTLGMTAAQLLTLPPRNVAVLCARIHNQTIPLLPRRSPHPLSLGPQLVPAAPGAPQGSRQPRV
jgi:hypothetical protein